MSVGRNKDGVIYFSTYYQILNLKKDVVDSTVRMIEQLYKAGKIVGEEKFNQAVANARLN